MYQSIPGHLTHVKLLTVGTLTQNESNEARPGGHLTSVLKRLSAVGNKWFRDSLIQQMRRFHGSFHMGFSVVEQLLSLRYIVISWNMPLFKVWSEDKLNKKFVVAENFAELVSKSIEAILFIFIYFMSAWRDRMLHATCDLAD